MGCHADTPEHDQSGYFDIEAAEYAGLGPSTNSAPISSLRALKPWRSAMRLRSPRSLLLSLNGPSGRSQAANPIEHAGHDPAQAILDRSRADAQDVHVITHFIQRALERLDEEGLLGSEVAVERRLGDACCRRDRVHVDVGVSMLCEQTDGGTNDALPPLGEHGPVRASTHGLMAI